MSKLEYIFEDDDLVAVNKPAGLIMHQDDHHTSGTVLDLVQSDFPEAQLLHRLDKDTSGVVLVAKNETAHEYYKKLFHDREIKKTYITILVGNLKHDEGSIDLPIARSTSDPRKRVVGGGSGKAREAQTKYTVNERFGDDFSVVRAFPLTGRTHQIRSHFASIGHPVACDALYGGKRYVCPEGSKRQLLHARAIEFTDRNGERRMIEAGLPKDFAETLDCLRKKAHRGTTV